MFKGNLFADFKLWSDYVCTTSIIAEGMVVASEITELEITRSQAHIRNTD